MSIPYESLGRRRQKARTRDALLGAARELISAGRTPTVEQTAEQAGISRATAYRYFPNQRALIVAAYPYIERRSLLPERVGEDVEERLAAVVDAHTSQILDLEPQLRAMLRFSLEPGAAKDQLLLRGGRAIGWIREALQPLRGRLSDVEIERLAIAVRSVEGIEALVWLTDVGGLSRAEAVAVMRWSATALLRRALAEGPPPIGTPPPMETPAGADAQAPKGGA